MRKQRIRLRKVTYQHNAKKKPNQMNKGFYGYRNTLPVGMTSAIRGDMKRIQFYIT